MTKVIGRLATQEYLQEVEAQYSELYPYWKEAAQEFKRDHPLGFGPVTSSEVAKVTARAKELQVSKGGAQ